MVFGGARTPHRQQDEDLLSEHLGPTRVSSGIYLKYTDQWNSECHFLSLAFEPIAESRRVGQQRSLFAACGTVLGGFNYFFRFVPYLWITTRGQP